MKITRREFVNQLDNQKVSLEKLRDNRQISDSAKDKLSSADLNRDGFIHGAEETNQLFKQLDIYDRNGDRDSVETDNSYVLNLHQAIMGAAEGVGSSNARPSNPLGELLANNPTLQTNQDLINLLMRRNHNNFNAAGAEARRYGLDINNLINDRDAHIQNNGSANTTHTTPTTATHTTPGSSRIGRVAGMENTSAAFRQKVSEVAQRLEMDPTHLMAVMSFETGESFSPSERNRATGATGLIQFMPTTARNLGTSTARLAQMTPERQLDFVEQYLRPYKGKMNTVEDAYMAVLWPAAVGKGPNHALFRNPSREYRQNRGLDINGNGVVTSREAASKVREKIR